MRNIGARSFLCVSVFCLLVAGCGSNSGASGSSGGTPSGSPCDKASDIRGSVTSISRVASGKLIGSIFIDGTKEQHAQFDRVSVSIGSTTQVFEKQGQQCQESSFAALKTGQRVQLQSTGVVLQSYPPQITATEIIILSEQQ